MYIMSCNSLYHKRTYNIMNVRHCESIEMSFHCYANIRMDFLLVEYAELYLLSYDKPMLLVRVCSNNIVC